MNRHSRVRTRVAAALVAAVTIGMLVGIPPQPAAAALPAGGMTAAALNTEFNSYGDTGGKWTSGDSTVSIPLPDGRNAWFFSDSLIGTVNADHTLPKNTPMVNNSLVVQDGADLVQTLHGGTAAAPTSLVRPTDGSADKYWLGDGTVEGDVLRVVYQRMKSTGTGPLDFAQLDSAVVTFDLPALTVRSIVDRGYGNRVAWGSAVLEDGAFTYIYGTEDAGQMRFAHLARVPAGGLSGAWQFWTGSGWSNAVGDSARVLSGVGAGFGVQKVGSSYVLVTQESNLIFSADFVAYTASSPTGPFAGPVQLFTAPEPAAIDGSFVYDSRVHPELARSGKLLVSYNVNSFVPDAVYADVRNYRPRFVEVDWPRPVPDPNAVPAAPTGVAAQADSSGTVSLSWQAPAGTGLTYEVHQRDMTAGQTHFARASTGVTGNSTDLNVFYQTGHTYEFRIAARNAAGTGPLSAAVAATVTIGPPGTPTGLTATATDGGVVTLNWNTVPQVWRYEVYRRDVTAGESEGARQWDSSPQDTTLSLNGLENGHQYAFQVVAVHGGGESPRSAEATATAFYSRPPTPTGLTATTQASGEIKLQWTHANTTDWFYVYQRDVTAGETDFTRLEWPVDTCCTMTAGGLADGHTYEYRVAALGKGGESTLSAVATATAQRPLPATPTGLSAAAQPDGSIKLTWQQSQPDVWFLVYQRDVTAGEAGFTKLEWPVTACCTMTAGGLEDGHSYEYKVSALSDAGESPASAVASATADIAPPAAPTNLRVTAGDGQAVLTWDGDAKNWHLVYLRDVTAGETVFRQLELPVTTCCTMTAGYLTNGHRYEFKITASGSGGEGAASTVVQVTPTAPLPAAPSGLTATAQADGTIKLAWNALAPDLWYQVYLRDVTAGDSTFTKLATPVTTCCTMTAGYLANGHSYEFKIAAINSGGEGPTGNLVSATSNQPRPPAPTNLRGQPAGSGTIELNWDAPVSGLLYWVYQRDVTAGQATFTKSTLPSDKTSATRGYLADGHVYEFKVTGESLGGEGAASATVRVTAVGGVPQAPSGLSAAAGDGKVTLSWAASPTGGSWYQVYLRNVSAGQSWQKVAAPVTTCCTMTAGYLANGDTYEFKVTAINGAGESTPTVVASAKPMPPVPAAPSGLTASAGDGKVVLRWTASPTASVYYDVYLRDTTAGQSWQKVKLPVTTCCTMTAGYLANGHRYEFKVAASNMAGQSATSNVAAATPLPPFPQAPSGLTASAGDGKVTLNWTASATANVYYLVEYRAAGAASWTRVKLPVTRCCTFVAGYLGNGTTYDFRVRATNQAGDSAPSNTASARPMPPLPQAPSGLTAAAGDGKVTLTWTKSSTPNVYYLVEYKTSTSSTWTKLKLPVTSCCTFVAGYLGNGTMYNFRVRATNMSGDSAASNIASAKPMPPVPKGVSYLSAASNGVSQVNLSWTASSTSGVLYWMEYRTAGDVRWIRLPLPASGTTASLKYGFSDGEVHEFRVIAFNMSGTSPYSPYADVVVKRYEYASNRARNDFNGSNRIATQVLKGGSWCDPGQGSRVCYGRSPGGDQPATVGDYFFYDKDENHYRNALRCEAYKRANIRFDSGRDYADRKGPDLPRHEAVHSDAYARYFFAGNFLADYGIQSALSLKTTGTPYLANNFEKEANLFWGGYVVWSSGRHYGGSTECGRWY
ncbi:fibronectin type III domain-containing protein [Micromonospora sp. NPDC005189]|uniref:fibronectin type III domain-containing protein n=1 Tax=unclassified Micromonospora TaxID=2617518 RepID=UPI0033A01AB6